MNGSVARHFSRAAESYERGSTLHHHVAARLTTLMPEPVAVGSGRVLELGCGTGVLTARLRQRFPVANLYAIDISEGMVRYLKSAYVSDERLCCAVGDARTLAVQQPFDLVVSSSALHWATPVVSVMRNVARLLKPGGRFVAAMMAGDTLRELHALRRTIAPRKIPAGRLAGVPEILNGLHESGLLLEGRSEEVVRARYRSGDEFLRTIHAQGLTGGAVSRAAQPLSRSELTELVKAYDLAYRDLDGGVYASFEVLYFEARAPFSEERMDQKGEP